MGGGILPTTIHEGRLYFLFGKESKYEDTAPGFSDFGGGNGNVRVSSACVVFHPATFQLIRWHFSSLSIRIRNF